MGKSQKGKFRKRIKAGTAVRRTYKKGQCSGSNPTSSKFREAAKNRFFNVSSRGQGSLTMDAIKKHDNYDDNSEINGDDAMSTMSGSIRSKLVGSLRAATISSWASNWTECTNTTFGRIHRLAAKSCALHEEILAILAAVTEIIKTKGGKETETEYFYILMTTLETLGGEREETIAAALYLMSLAIKRVPNASLRSRFSEIVKLLNDLLAKHAGTELPSLLRSVLVCMAHLLRVQEPAIWRSSSTMHVYDCVLAFVEHRKPKVRKTAQDSVRAILKGSVFLTTQPPGNVPKFHPAASATAKFCIRRLEGTCIKDPASAMHFLELVKDIVGTFPADAVKATCTAILGVISLVNVKMASVAMKALNGLFLSEPHSDILSAETNAQIIAALYGYQPGTNDLPSTVAWLAVMESAHLNLYRLDYELGLDHLPRLFKSCMSLMLSDQQEVPAKAADTLIQLLERAVAPSRDQLVTKALLAAAGAKTTVQKLFGHVETGLGFQYCRSWHHVLRVLAEVYRVLGKHCGSTFMADCLATLADLRGSENFSRKVELDQVLGAAVETMGPKAVLEAVPLRITGGEGDDVDFPRDWLLPLLRDHLCGTEMAFFASYFYPLAMKLSLASKRFAGKGSKTLEKAYETLELQVWSLLPGFCTDPVDIRTALKGSSGMAKIMADVLMNRSDLRREVMGALRKLIASSSRDKQDQAELAKFSGNFLSRLFNTFAPLGSEIDEQNPERLSVMDTIKQFLPLADHKLVSQYFDKCHAQLLDATGNDSKRQHAMLDLMIALIAYLKHSSLEELFPFVRVHLNSQDRTTQKKCYRILESMGACESAECREFFAANLNSLLAELSGNLSKSTAGSIAPRLRCLRNVVKRLDHEPKDLVKALLGEAVLCAKAQSQKAKEAAFDLLVEMCSAMIRWRPEEEKGQVVEQYLQLLVVGLSLQPHVIACTTLALARVLLHFKDCIGADILESFTDNVSLLLRSAAREIVQSALGLMKALLSVFGPSSLAKAFRKIAAALDSISEDHQRHFRRTIKDVLARLVRKFGYENVQGAVTSDNLRKVIKNTFKVAKRAKRLKESFGAREEEEDREKAAKQETAVDLLRDTDSEIEEGADADQAERKKSKKGRREGSRKNAEKERGATWLDETGDEIVDFLDNVSASKRVVASKPKQTSSATKNEKQNPFKIAADGRIIVTEDLEEGEEKRKSKGGGKSKDRKRGANKDIDELLDDVDNMEIGKRRKLSVADKKIAADSDDDENKSGGNGRRGKYRPGGGGIHRKTASSSGSSPKTANTKGSGAEYRSKKSGGDVKKKGKPDPYAYIPLDKKLISKKKRAKAVSQLKSSVPRGKKGKRRSVS